MANGLDIYLSYHSGNKEEAGGPSLNHPLNPGSLYILPKNEAGNIYYLDPMEIYSGVLVLGGDYGPPRRP